MDDSWHHLNDRRVGLICVTSIVLGQGGSKWSSSGHLNPWVYHMKSILKIKGQESATKMSHQSVVWKIFSMKQWKMPCRTSLIASKTYCSVSWHLYLDIEVWPLHVAFARALSSLRHCLLIVSIRSSKQSDA